MGETAPTMPGNATAEAVKTKLRREWKHGEKDMVDALLSDAWSDLLEDVPTLEERLKVEQEPRLAERVGRTLVAAVVRVARNPEGWRQVGLDDFQGTRDTILSAGLLQFTPDELARLQPRVAELPGFYSMQMGVPYWG